MNFCSHCGSRLRPGFRFCPSCGEKLADSECSPAESCDFPTPVSSQLEPIADLSLTRNPIKSKRRSAARSTSSSAPTLDTDLKLPTSQKRKVSLEMMDEEPMSVSCQTTSFEPNADSFSSAPVRSKCRPAGKRSSSPSTPPKATPQTDLKPVTPQKQKASPGMMEKEQKVIISPLFQNQGKAKRAKRCSFIKPCSEGMELCDQADKKWRLGKLLQQTDAEMTYQVQPASKGTASEDWSYILRMGAKAGQLHNELTFFQRAAKSNAVERWIKSLKLDFLGIPSCEGFGLYEENRFLIFHDMGQTLQSILSEVNGTLSKKTVLQLALRLVDALEYMHEKEYAHGDIHAGNIYISPHGNTKVFLSGFSSAFRFCPNGKHVDYREGSRTLHQGNIHFISLDSHKGTGPSCRSDLQSLAYCLLFWMTGTLPWLDDTLTPASIAAKKEGYMTDGPELLSYCFQKKVSGVLGRYLSHVFPLEYTEKPDYKWLRNELQCSLLKLGGTLKEPLSF